MPLTNLKPVSGAEFFGTIERLDEDRLFRASCYAQLQQSARLERDAPKFWMCATEAAAQKWIEVQAAQRAFAKYTIVKQDSPVQDRRAKDAWPEPAAFAVGRY